MVNTGRPSAGCALCRSRRIKCDEGRPECRKCIKLGRTCPGYSRELTVKVFKGSSGSKQKREHVKIDEAHAEYASAYDAGEWDTDRGMVTRTQPPACAASSTTYVPAKLSENFDDASLDLFFTSFALSEDQDHSHPLFLTFLPELYIAARLDSCLRHAVTAVARLNFINRYASATFSDWATISYARTLVTTNRALSDGARACSDETLTAVWLLSLYEVLLSDTEPHNQSKVTPWRNHINGTISLLVVRDSKQFCTRQGRQLFVLVHTTSVIMTMVAQQKPSQQLTRLIRQFLENGAEEVKGEFLVAECLQTVALLRAILRAQNLCILSEYHQSSEASSEMIRVLLQAVHATELSDFERWTLTRSEWRPNPVPIHIRERERDTEYSLHYFQSIFVMSNWVTFWTARLLLQQSVIEALVESGQTTFPSTSDKISVSRDDILVMLQKSAADILGSVSFAFQEILCSGMVCRPVSSATRLHSRSSIGAIHVFWPLGAILASQYTTPRQKTLARNALRDVGGRFGIAQALRYV